MTTMGANKRGTDRDDYYTIRLNEINRSGLLDRKRGHPNNPQIVDL